MNYVDQRRHSMQTWVCNILNKTASFAVRVLEWLKPAWKRWTSMTVFMSGCGIANCRREVCNHDVYTSHNERLNVRRQRLSWKYRLFRHITENYRQGSVSLGDIYIYSAQRQRLYKLKTDRQGQTFNFFNFIRNFLCRYKTSLTQLLTTIFCL